MTSTNSRRTAIDVEDFARVGHIGGKIFLAIKGRIGSLDTAEVMVDLDHEMAGDLISALEIVRNDAACPSWCSSHVIDLPDCHYHRVIVGNMAVEIQSDPDKDGGKPIVEYDDCEWANGQDLTDLITALRTAQQIIEGHRE